MLLASPAARRIILGRVIASLTHLILYSSHLAHLGSLLALGGLSVYEVLAAYLGLLIPSSYLEVSASL